MKDHYLELKTALTSFYMNQSSKLEAISREISEAISEGGVVYVFGNGGSASQAQHFAAEMMGRFSDRKRSPYHTRALTTDTSILTAVSNDYGFDRVFSRQLEDVCSPFDVAIGISTSGESKNVLEGMKMAQRQDAYCVGLSGKPGSSIEDVCDEVLNVNSVNTQIIQEVHLFILHEIVRHIENILDSLPGKETAPV